MRQTVRTLALASILSLAGAAPILLAGPAGAQEGGAPAAPRQVALTQKTIDGLIAAQPAMDAAQAKAKPSETGDVDPRVSAAMTAAAKKSGFASLEDYEAAGDSVGVVLAGIDPETKSYVGQSAVIRRQLKQVQADTSMPAKDKAEAIKEMKDALAAGDTVKPLPGNVDLVIKNYDRLSQLLQGGGGNGGGGD